MRQKSDLDTTTVRALADEASATITALAADPQCTHGLRRALNACLVELGRFEQHLRPSASDATSGVRRVQIGGGKRLLPGFCNIDIADPADLVTDVREGIPLPDGSVEFVFTEHFLEHVDYPVSAKTVLAECHRILEPGGELVVGVPDAAFVLAGYAAGDAGVREQLMSRWYGRRDGLHDYDTYLGVVNLVFRDQDASTRYSPHLWAYDYETLSALCRQAGFVTVEPWEHDPTIGNPDRAWGSVYVAARK
ncbi:class I SAM-dependent methyltransferase [Longispora albida]|uniref:class I SAM-dependent methyltransferase n=1 Tax=Longispora albida TaxID=203523 RepID=UPI000475D5F7|nr:methyltransferase domain-containing protein [Longispora albida]